MYLGVCGGVGVNIMMDLREVGWKDLKWTHQAQDRDY
jgi:hypothetical protein